MTIGEVISMFMLSVSEAPHTTQPGAIVRNDEIIIRERAYPQDARKTFTGTCGRTEYEISVYLGRPLDKSVQALAVNGVIHTASAQRAIPASSPETESVTDVVVSECLGQSAKIRFVALRLPDIREVHFYHILVHSDGRIDHVAEE